MSVVRVALTETRNAYQHMPATLDQLGDLAPRLDDLRRANVDHHVELIAQGAALGTKLVCLGELFTGPYFALGTDPMWKALAEDAHEGATVTSLREAARQHGMIVVAPIYEHDSVIDECFNTAVVIDETGEVIGKYRKTHIPAGTNEQGEFHETFYYGASNGDLGTWERNISANRFFPVFQTSVCKLGIAICYDRHFPGVMKTLAENGAELVVSPAVTFGDKSRRMWEIEFAVDAARHNLFIGGSNRVGSEPPWSQEYFGASYFVGPNGRADALPDTPNLVVADIDLAELRGPDPSGWNLGRDLRSDIY